MQIQPQGPEFRNYPETNQCPYCGLKFVLILFDLILYVHSTIFQLCRTVLPGFNQY